MAESMGKMIKRAFKWHWHLLALGAGSLLAVLSGRPEMFAVLAALELGYLGFLGTNPRFQNVLRGRSLQDEEAQKQEAQQQQKLAEVMRLLSVEDKERFASLQQRCSELIELRHSLERTSVGGSDRFRTASLDKMLWFFLKILNQKAGIERFLSSTDRQRVVAERERAAVRLAGIPDGRNERLAATISDQLLTIDERLVNYDAASENMELVVAELEKTEQKIKHICESGITGMDSGELSMRIDSISETLRSSEEDFVPPGLRSILEEDIPPSFISVTPPMISE